MNVNKGIFSIIIFAFLFVSNVDSVHSSSVSATGIVDSVWTSGGMRYLRILRSDNSTLTADCGSSTSAIDTQECSIATPQETSWGRADCNGGFCSWSCLDVVDNCSGSETIVGISGTVVGKDLCAGNLYLTVLVSGSGEIRARCLGDLYDDCDSKALNSSVNAGIRLKCSDGEWSYVN